MARWVLLDEWQIRWLVPTDLPLLERQRLAQAVRDPRLFRCLRRRLQRALHARSRLSSIRVHLAR